MTNKKPVMRETYTGMVVSIGDETVTCLYEVDGKLIEQTYLHSQFIGGKPPEEGTSVVVKVLVCSYEPEPPSTEEIKKLEELDARIEKVRKPLTGPVEF